MTRRTFHCLLLATLLVITPLAALAQPFLVGTVRWDDGNPARGMEVRLLRGNQTVAETFTDQEGFYAFHGIQGQPGDFHIDVLSASGKLTSQPVPVPPLLQPGSQVPDITLP